MTRLYAVIYLAAVLLVATPLVAVSLLQEFAFSVRLHRQRRERRAAVREARQRGGGGVA